MSLHHWHMPDIEIPMAPSIVFSSPPTRRSLPPLEPYLHNTLALLAIQVTLTACNGSDSFTA